MPVLPFAPIGRRAMRQMRVRRVWLSLATVSLLAAATLAPRLLAASHDPAQGGEKRKEAPPKKIAIRAGRLIDAKSDAPITNALILIEGDKIVSVTPGGTAPAGVEVIDLSKAT